MTEHVGEDEADSFHARAMKMKKNSLEFMGEQSGGTGCPGWGLKWLFYLVLQFGPSFGSVWQVWPTFACHPHSLPRLVFCFGASLRQIGVWMCLINGVFVFGRPSLAKFCAGLAY